MVDNRLDPEVAGIGCRRLIAAAVHLAWQDAVGNMGTYRDSAYREAWKKSATEWIGSAQYCGWMEILDMDPSTKPEQLIEDYGAVIWVIMDG